MSGGSARSLVSAIAIAGTSLAFTLAPTGATASPQQAFQLLQELNNKLDRTIKKLEGARKGAIDVGQLRWTLHDVAATKHLAIEQFPTVYGLPFAQTFEPLACMDERFAEGQVLLTQLEGGHLGLVNQHQYVHRALTGFLKQAKECKDSLEVELVHTFDLKPTEEMEVGVNETTPTGTDTTTPGGLNVPGPLEHAYATNGFIGRHEHDYVATGVDGGHPDTWPPGKTVSFFDVFDLFNSTTGAQAVEKASEQNLESHGFAPVPDTSLGPGEKVFELQPSGSPLLSTIIYVQRGSFILKIAGSCKGCTEGSIESSLETLAQLQLTQAVNNGFPGPAPHGGSGGCSGRRSTGSMTLALPSGGATYGYTYYPTTLPASCGSQSNTTPPYASYLINDSNGSVISCHQDPAAAVPSGVSKCPGISVTGQLPGCTQSNCYEAQPPRLELANPTDTKFTFVVVTDGSGSAPPPLSAHVIYIGPP